jgi:hypothetical protein
MSGPCRDPACCKPQQVELALRALADASPTAVREEPVMVVPPGMAKALEEGRLLQAQRKDFLVAGRATALKEPRASRRARLAEKRRRWAAYLAGNGPPPGRP